MKKIYSKFVKERKKEFQIETAMWQDDGRRVITKRNLYAEGEKHIQNIYDTFLMYRDRKILCDASLEGNVIAFEYVSGKTLEEILLEAVRSGNKEEILNTARQYDEILGSVCREEERADINSEEGFEAVFGAAAGSAAGYRNAIFDLTFDNIICQGQTNKIIDYEWRFSFAVEKEFIKFRAVYAFLMKYAGNTGHLFTKEEFYSIFGIEYSKCETYMAYNNHFVNYIYGSDGYNHVLEKYKKNTMNVCDGRVLSTIKALSGGDAENGEFYENKTYDLLLDIIREHGDLYDDYHKFFQVTNKVRAEKPAGYLSSREFYEEFGAYVKGSYDMLEYYRTEASEKQKVVDEVSGMLEKKTRENIQQEEKYRQDYDKLTKQIRSLEEKLQYIQSCKAYKAFLAKKVEERFE